MHFFISSLRHPLGSDMGLREYKRKRDFRRTPEPVGIQAPKGGRLFVIQKHRARHLHYDFRLELEGVLKSWAVPKGPSLDPSVKRLAMQVEDHPVDYGSFEGIIPEGEYGGGTVMLWDQGEWEPIGNPHEDYRRGRLKYKLHGQKLRGGWVLVRTGGEASRQRWLLFKERDEEARPGEPDAVVEDKPLSVSTGRTLDDIAAHRDSVWTSNRNGNAKTMSRQTAKKQPRPRAVSKIPARKGSLPDFIEVQLATLAKEAPEGDEWLHEIKLDGYRLICRIDHGSVRFLSRNHKDWTERFPSLVEAAKSLPVQQAIIDGEVVVVRPDGTTNYQDLQNIFGDPRGRSLYYYAFDLLHLDGRDLIQAPLEERKQVLADLLSGKKVSQRIRFSEHMAGNGPAFFQQACNMGVEGIISKRRDQPYRAGRGYDWLKVKCVQTGEFVIGGYTEPAGTRTAFGALLVGYHDAKGKLVYAGKVGTGFTDRTLRTLLERMQPLHRKDSPFTDRKRAGEKTHWVDPKLVVQIVFGSWTDDRLLRHASFQGLREENPQPRSAMISHCHCPVRLAKRGAATPRTRDLHQPREMERCTRRPATTNTMHASSNSLGFA